MTPFERIQQIAKDLRLQLYRREGRQFRIAVSGYYDGGRKHIFWWDWDGTKRDLINMLRAVGAEAPFHEDYQYVLWATHWNMRHRDTLPHQDITRYIHQINLGA